MGSQPSSTFRFPDISSRFAKCCTFGHGALISSYIYKGKKKPVAQSSLYRRITVTPQIGSILDRCIDPIAENVFKSHQSPDQNGFTKDVSYLMAAVPRGECQRWALDSRQTCFGVRFDGKAAFPSVEYAAARALLLWRVWGSSSIQPFYL